MSIILWLWTTVMTVPFASCIRLRQWETPIVSGSQRVSVSTRAVIRWLTTPEIS